jgi:cyanate permease
MRLTNRWAVLALMFMVGLTIPTQFQAVAALAPFLVNEARLTYTDIGALTGMFMAPGIFLAAPGGLLVARIGDKAAMAAGLFVMLGAALLFAATDSYATMAAARLVGGAGAVFVSILVPKIVTDWFVGKEIATALATVSSSFGLGVGVTIGVLPWIASQSSWSNAALANAAVTGLALIFLLVLFPKSGDARGGNTNHPTLWRITATEAILASLAGGGRMLFSTGYVVFMSFAPPLLIARGMSAAEAGFLTSLAGVVSIVSVPLGGALSDWTRKPNLFIVGGAVGTALACAFLPYVAPAALWILLFGVLRGGCTGGIMALPSQVLRPESRAAGFAIASAVYFIGMAGLPPIAGYLFDATSDAATPVLFAGLLWILIPILLIVFKTLQRKWPLGDLPTSR